MLHDELPVGVGTVSGVKIGGHVPTRTSAPEDRSLLPAGTRAWSRRAGMRPVASTLLPGTGRKAQRPQSVLGLRHITTSRRASCGNGLIFREKPPPPCSGVRLGQAAIPGQIAPCDPRRSGHFRQQGGPSIADWLYQKVINRTNRGTSLKCRVEYPCGASAQPCRTRRVGVMAVAEFTQNRAGPLKAVTSTGGCSRAPLPMMPDAIFATETFT